MNILFENITRLHTTPLGEIRIRRNLGLNDCDAVEVIKDLIMNPNAVIERVGKNYYIRSGHCRITVNARSFTIITAHKIK